jgi:nucleoside-diphosphate-sugar epimerase
MGGIGFIETHTAEIMRDSALLNLHMIAAARLNGAQRFLFSSSACVYPQSLQRSTDVTPLKEEDAYPADAEDGYGWEKLSWSASAATSRLRARKRAWFLYNIYGTGTYDGGREKSPAAICRKIALAKDGETIEVWGDGRQTRSYCYVADCVEGIYRLMHSDYRAPLNLGTDRLVTINELVHIVANIAGKTTHKRHDLTKPQGVRATRQLQVAPVLGREPPVSPETGSRAPTCGSRRSWRGRVGCASPPEPLVFQAMAARASRSPLSNASSVHAWSQFP